MTAPARATSAGGTGARGQLVALSLAVSGAVTLLASAGRGWARVVAESGQGVRLPVVSVTGAELVPLVGAAGVVGLAAVAAVIGTRGTARRVCGALVLLLGLGVVPAVMAGTGAGHVRAVAAGSPGTTSTSSARHAAVDRTGWPVAGLAGGMALAVAGAMVTVRGQGWPGLSARHERGTARQPSPRDGTPEQLWESLDRGEDPTA